MCCVKYNPNTAHEIAVGSADHNVHLYDLRKPSAPVHVFSGEHTTSFFVAQDRCVSLVYPLLVVDQ